MLQSGWAKRCAIRQRGIPVWEMAVAWGTVMAAATPSWGQGLRSRQMAGTGLEHHEGFMSMGTHGREDGRLRAVQVNQDVAGVVVLGIGMKIDIAALTIACTQEPDGGQIHQLVCGPQPFPGERPFGEAVNQANEIQLARHGRELAADRLPSENESAIKHTIPQNAPPRVQRATARRWSPHPICSSRCRQTRRWYQIEGALECVFKGMRKLSIRG